MHLLTLILILASLSPSCSAITVSDALRAAAVERISVDTVGREVLSRFNGPEGTVALPSIVIEDIGAGEAEYDYRRRAIVVDRAAVVAAIAAEIAPKDRPALVQFVASRDSLLAYLNVHPEAASAFAAQNDATLVHEFAHAWQDLRDPVMQEMARNALPRAILVEYEVEAWSIKNLYIASRLRDFPATPVNALDLLDFEDMTLNYARWAAALKSRYRRTFVNALDIATARRIQTSRSAEGDLRNLDQSENTRLSEFSRMGKKISEEGPALLARHYRLEALRAQSPIQQAVLLQKSEDWTLKGRSP